MNQSSHFLIDQMTVHNIHVHVVVSNALTNYVQWIQWESPKGPWSGWSGPPVYHAIIEEGILVYLDSGALIVVYTELFIIDYDSFDEIVL